MSRMKGIILRPGMWPVILLVCFPAFMHVGTHQQQGAPDSTWLEAKIWADSVFNQMTLAERVGQLMMIRAHSDKGADHEAFVLRMVREFHVGGLCFFQGTPERQAILTNRYQEAAKIPLMIAMDAEWGLGMRMRESTISFPRQMTLGAIDDERLIYEMGREVARQLLRLGVHVNFAPVADVNNNPANPVIGDRSFGEVPMEVAVRSYMYMRGMQDGGVMASAKHFPGHGDTGVDSHYDLPVIRQTRARLDTVELVPFSILASQQVGSMMSAHISMPLVDTVTGYPASFSPYMLNHILRSELGFDGLIFTDGLEMQGASKMFRPGAMEVQAILAGNDVLLLPQQVVTAHRALTEAVQQRVISEETLKAAVTRILRAKHEWNILKNNRVQVQNIRAELNTREAENLKEKLYEAALTCTRNKGELLPLRNMEPNSLVMLAVGSGSRTHFQNHLAKYWPADLQQIGWNTDQGTLNQLRRQWRNKHTIVVSLHGLTRNRSAQYGMTNTVLSWLEQLADDHRVVIVSFGSPYTMEFLGFAQAAVCAYEADPLAQRAAAHGIAGAIPITGRLPVGAGSVNSLRVGQPTLNLNRLKYAEPETVGMSSEALGQIDRIMEEAIRKRATPGGQVMVVRNNTIVWDKAYGHHDYSRQTPVSVTDLYDVASITKVAASTLAIMKLHQDGIINIDLPLSTYLPELKRSNKENMVIRDILAHMAGFSPWIPFYRKTLTAGRNPRPDAELYRPQSSYNYTIEVANNIYLHKDYPYTMVREIAESPLNRTAGYRYSDLGFILFSRLVQQVSGMPLDEYLQEYVYGPLDLHRITFNPLRRFSIAEITPSEEDTYFRHQRIQGYVHDMGAAMFGGVCGHAGLFSNTHDLAVIFRMLLNQGTYGVTRILKPETVAQYTTRHNRSSRRGLGFDMKELNSRNTMNMSELAGNNTFGHLGFTGTAVWADPDNDLILIFLSNRTFPSADNWELNKLSVRPEIHAAVYRALPHTPQYASAP